MRRPVIWVLKAGSLPGGTGALAEFGDEDRLQGTERGERPQDGKNLGV